MTNTNTLATRNRHLSGVRSSLAQDLDLGINLSPGDIYAFHSSNAFGNALPDGRRQHVVDCVREFATVRGSATSPDRLLSRLELEGEILTPQEKADLEEVLRSVRRRGVIAQSGFEKAVAADGYAQPAIAALVALVAVAVVFWVFVVQEA